jgi:hypothetical protein
MNTLNPLRIAGSVLGSGLIFSKDPDKSSHSKPNGQAKRLGPIFQTHVRCPLDADALCLTASYDTLHSLFCRRLPEFVGLRIGALFH